MATNIENANISAIKLGTANVTKSYIGHQEVYPNTKEIAGAVFTDTSTIANTGGTRTYRVTGDVGSQYTLAGSNGASSLGAQNLSTSPTDYSISISSNASCGASSRTPTVTITPSGSTTLASGVSNTSSFTQSAGPSLIQYSATHSISITTNQYPTVSVNGVLHYATGTVWTITGTVNGNGNLTKFYAWVNGPYGNTNQNVSRVFTSGGGQSSVGTSGGLYITPTTWANTYNTSGSGTWTQTVTLSSGSLAYFTVRPQASPPSVAEGGNACQRLLNPADSSYVAWPYSTYHPTITRYP